MWVCKLCIVIVLCCCELSNTVYIKQKKQNHIQDKFSPDDYKETLHYTRHKRSVDDFVREEVKTLEQSDFFLESFLKDSQYRFPLEPTEELLLAIDDINNISNHEADNIDDEFMVDVDSTFHPRQHAWASKQKRSTDEMNLDILQTEDLLNRLKELAKNPTIREWLGTTGSKLLTDLIIEQDLKSKAESSHQKNSLETTKEDKKSESTEQEEGAKPIDTRVSESVDNSIATEDTSSDNINAVKHTSADQRQDKGLPSDDIKDNDNSVDDSAGDSIDSNSIEVDGIVNTKHSSAKETSDTNTKPDDIPDTEGGSVRDSLNTDEEKLQMMKFIMQILQMSRQQENVIEDPVITKKKVVRKVKDECVNVQNILANDTAQEVKNKQGRRMSCYMNQDADPCHDFYDYACGNWDLYHPIPMDRGGYDTFEILREGLDIKLKSLLQSDLSADDSETTKSVKTLYKSCMNTDEIERRGEKPLVSLLEDLGGWPVLQGQDWNQTDFDWIKLIGKLRLFNNDILISLWVGPDGKNSDQYVVQFDQSDLVLPSSEYYHQGIKHPIMKAYKRILVNIAVLLGADPELAEKEMQNVIDFEIRLSKIMTPPHERRNFSKMYEKLSLRELAARHPKFNFTKYLDVVLPDALDDDHDVVIYASKYFTKLTDLIEDTEARTLGNYILMRFVRHRINNLDKRFERIQNEIYRLLYGREEMPPRWKFCIAYVNGNLGMGVGALFVEKYFDRQSKQDMLNLTREIQDQFQVLLEASSWLSDSTKQTASKKLDAMIHNIGYPDLVEDPSQLMEEIQGLSYNEAEFFENVLENLQGRTFKEMSMLGKTVNRTIWTTTPAVVNAYYSRNRNQIMFPAGILQPPFYHKHFPKALNYGGIGVVIGHEITHGFDDKGKQFDDLGNIHQWWDEDSSSKFSDKAQCIIDQYSSFRVTEVGANLNGMNTQGENIADNGGIKQAYKAFRNWLGKQDYNEKEERMSYLELNPDQLFFLNFAQVWCGTARPEALRSKLKTAVHAPGKYRVLGTLSNSEDFQRVFSCESKAKMNPVDKCKVW